MRVAKTRRVLTTPAQGSKLGYQVAWATMGPEKSAMVGVTVKKRLPVSSWRAVISARRAFSIFFFTEQPWHGR